MAIRAVDLAMPIQRTPELNRSNLGEQRPETQHQQFAERLSKEAAQQEKQVQQAPKGEEAQIQKDGRGNNGGYESRNHKKKEKKKQESAKDNKTSNSMFDITI
ncbi:MAG: hypothetical protein FWC91_00635 [Defluviitaleaceae bacterium]|nr:hypothetical protein [Defluviitaleaceae bacterium]